MTDMILDTELNDDRYYFKREQTIHVMYVTKSQKERVILHEDRKTIIQSSC